MLPLAVTISSTILATAPAGTAMVAVSDALAASGFQGNGPSTQAASPWSMTAHDSLRYRYVDVGYALTDTGIEGAEDDDTGVYLQAAYPLTERFYLLAQVSHTTGDRTLGTVPPVTEELSATVAGIGGGYHHPLRAGLDALIEGLATYNDQSLADASDDSFGYFARTGVRWLGTPRIELELDARSIGREDVDSEFGFGATARVHITNALSLGLNFSDVDEQSTLALGARFGW